MTSAKSTNRNLQQIWDLTTNSQIPPYLSGTPTGPDAAGIARDSSGNYITAGGSGNPGLVVDPTNFAGQDFLASQARCLVTRDSGQGYTPDYVFSDDTLIQGDGGNDRSNPADYSLSSYTAGSITEINNSPTKVLGANTLSLVTYGIDSSGVASASNVQTLMLENYLIFQGALQDLQTIHSVTGNTPWWTLETNVQDEVHSKYPGKDFWAFPDNAPATQSDSSASGIQDRLYFFTSFMLGYQPQDIFEETFSTPSGSQIEPETQIVATNPLIASPANVAATTVGGNVYAREFAQCFYKGSSIGRCAFVVNPDPNKAPALPSLTQSYAHSATLVGSDVLDGGSVTFMAAVPSTIGEDSGLILTQ